MELRQLRYFIAVAEEASFTRGAQRLLVAQPAVSQQIRRLERELGEPLFTRDSRSVALTAAGETLLPHARATLSAAARAREAVSALGKLLAGRLRVGLVQAQPDSWVVGLLGAFHERYPQVRIALLDDDPGPLFDGVASGELDVAFVGLAQAPPPGVDVELVSAEPLVVAVANGHRLARRRRLGIADLAGHALASLVPGTGLRAVVEHECDQAGIVPRFAAETTDLSLLADLVAKGVGVAVIPASVVAGRDDVATVSIVPAIERRIALAWRGQAPMSPAGRAFLAMARSG
jgi:DNA-binding transcriptional LysR family regulator